MIRVSVLSRFKSILTNFDQDLPDFTIISGVNGAGKSHLLQAIEQGYAKVYDEYGIELTKKKYLTSVALVPNEAIEVHRSNFTYEITNIYQSIRTYISAKVGNPNAELKNYLQGSYIKVVDFIMRESGKDVEDLTTEDIKEHYPIHLGLVTDVFHQNFSTLFKRYHDALEENLFSEYLKTTKNKNRKYLSDENFRKKHGDPPWDFVNKVFQEAGLDYTINDPIENDRDLPFTFRLINKINNANVNFSDLSSGEKVLMSLTLALYNSKFEVDFPNLLLMDEPDGPLHPSMAKRLLQVIQEVFVKDKGVKVIMTTHSPSTVAMAQEESLFVMQKESPRIKKESKEQILKLLTEGIPSFSIYSINARQVFVESHIDVDFYNKIYLKLKKLIPNDKSLHFIPSSVTKGNTGNCNQVKEIVNSMCNANSQTVYGIIDWDKTNNGNDKIFILGNKQRYSLENYILDPVIVVNFILREKIRKNNYFGLSEDENHMDFRNYDNSKLQNIVDIFINDVYSIVNKEENSLDNSNKASVMYVNGRTLNLPVWYLHYQGHDLENALKNTYIELRKFEKMKVEILKKVFDDLPDFIPVEILHMLQNLHN
jgi:predicted ATPase